MTSRRSQLVLPVVLTVLCAMLVLPAGAAADDGDDRDVRRAGTCTGSSHSTLRLRLEDGSIRIEFEVDASRGSARWTVILLHERRIAYRGGVQRHGGGSFKLRYTVPDWLGVDRIVARATGPQRETCRVEAVV